MLRKIEVYDLRDPSW